MHPMLTFADIRRAASSAVRRRMTVVSRHAAPHRQRHIPSLTLSLTKGETALPPPAALLTFADIPTIAASGRTE